VQCLVSGECGSQVASGRSGKAADPKAGGGSYFVATVLPDVSLMDAHLVWISVFRESGSAT